LTSDPIGLKLFKLMGFSNFSGKILKIYYFGYFLKFNEEDIIGIK
jgi:hypothetical protein